MVEANRFRFLNLEGAVDDAADWNHSPHGKLWLYNLHYFDHLRSSATPPEWATGSMRRWVEDNPPGVGNGWQPYPLSLRIVNWIAWALNGEEPSDAWRASLGLQTRWLRSQLEWHLLGNHLFANLKALIFAGAYFEGREAEDWLRLGVAELEKQIAEQFLADGGHFERSPMYQALMVEDLLDLVNLATAYPDVVDRRQAALWRTTASKALDWLAAMTHPDGGPSFFNDATGGVALSLAQLRGAADRLAIRWSNAPTSGVTDLAASGYARARYGRQTLNTDAAPLGSDYLLGHGHADSLSFE